MRADEDLAVCSVSPLIYVEGKDARDSPITLSASIYKYKIAARDYTFQPRYKLFGSTRDKA